MQVMFAQHVYSFRPWKPALGRVFNELFAFDCETTRIDEDRPWVTPAYVIGAGFDGRNGYFVRRSDVAAFFAAHEAVQVAFHHAAFDLAVLNTVDKQLDIYSRVDQNLVWDTQILHRLYMLGTAGHTAGGKGESTLEHCAGHYLNVQLPKDVTDSEGEVVRLSYGKWLTRPVTEIEQVYLEYLAKDAIVTHLLYGELRRRLDSLLARSSGVWGYVSPGWLAEQVRRWGPQTHHIQIRAAIVLAQITRNGLHLDVARREELAEELKVLLDQQRQALGKFGYLPGGEGSGKSLQAILRRQESAGGGLKFPRTESGLYAASHEVLQDLASTVPFIKILLEYRATEKLLGSFVKKMGKRALHPSFNVLARTGRTTSFGEINAQNLPTDDRVRSCFVPVPGHVFIDADYKTIEMATLAQACVSQFGLHSKMAEAINAGQDLHTLVAARVKNKPEAEVTKDERKKAKPINFGKPGGMGNATMKQYAKVSYGVHLDDAEVQALSDTWFNLFPEMQSFLRDNGATPLELARLFDFTPASHCEHTGDRRFVGHRENVGREHQPHHLLGCMFLKAIKVSDPKTDTGKPYTAGDLDYFWTRLEGKNHLLPRALQSDVAARRPSVRLQRAVMSMVGLAGVFTLTGRLRANASYCARHNTVFQGLAADGAKLALWLLWREGYRIANFVHDQVLVEVPADSDLMKHAELIRSLMIEGMQAVVTDVKVDVTYAAVDRWYKDAEAVINEKDQQLLLWQSKSSTSGS